MIFKISIAILAILLSIYSAYSQGRVCTLIYDPVCGSDNKTYGNGCQAASNNVSYVKGKCPCSFEDHSQDEPVCVDGVQFPNSCVAEEAGKTNYTEGGCVCTEEYAPVCGADGETYGNKCAARAANQTYTVGVCTDNGGVCPFIEKPVCADGVEFPNSCIAENAGQKNYKEGGCACTREYVPVCGADGQTYGNKCEARRFNQTYTEGPCPTVCTTDYTPVCAGNITYSNACVAQNAGQTDFTLGECSNNGENGCTEEYRPVCASCKTYSNECEAKRAGETKIVPGECPCTRKQYKRNCPVCADGVRQYRNKCFAKDAGDLYYENGPCPKPTKG